MHVRVNIPWLGVSELLAALRALVGVGPKPDLALAQAIERSEDVVVLSMHRTGRAGLVAVLEALGVRGGRAIVPAYVCPAVLAALASAEVAPVFVDVERDSFRFDADALGRQLQAAQADVIIAANTYGHDQDFRMLAKTGLPVIDDAAYQGGLPPRSAAPTPGTRGTVGIWSFNFKALAGIGGGLVVAGRGSEGQLYVGAGDRPGPRVRSRDLRLLTAYLARSMFRERIPRFLPGATLPGADSAMEASTRAYEATAGSMSLLQASIALSLWRRQRRVQARYMAANALLETTIAESGIAGLVRRIPGGPYPHQYPMVVAEALADPSMVAMRLRQELHARGVQTEEPYPVPAPIVEVCPNAASLRNRLVLLPVSAGYGDHVYRHVASALTEAARSVMVESGPE